MWCACATLVPTRQTRTLTRLYIVCVQVLESKLGHDMAFQDVTEIEPLVAEHLEATIREELQSEQVHTTGLSSP